jgi:hypothetical protein
MRTFTITIALTVGLLSAMSAAADTWVEPGNVKVKSGNGRFTALLLPAAKAPKPRAARVHVYEGEPGANGKWSTIWAVNLTNESAPVTVILSDDARYLVTLDNWHGVGRGPDTVAFYERDGKGGKQLARYALEQILTADELSAVRRTVSSAWWRDDGPTLFDEADDASRYLCVWVGSTKRWLSWDATTGKAVDAKSADASRRRWDDRARAWAIRQFATDRGDVAIATRFLSALDDPRDRELVARHRPSAAAAATRPTDGPPTTVVIRTNGTGIERPVEPR